MGSGSVLWEAVFLGRVEPVACFGFGIVSVDHRLICARLLAFSPCCGKLCRLRRPDGRGLCAIGSLLRADCSVPRLPRCRFRLDGSFLSYGGRSYCPSGNRRRLVRGYGIPFR